MEGRAVQRSRDESQRQTSGAAAAAKRPSSCAAVSGSSVTIRPSSRRAAPSHMAARIDSGTMPIYEYACMECEQHFEELVRSEEQQIACPDCGATNVRKQFSRSRSPAPLAADLRRRGGRVLRRRLRLLVVGEPVVPLRDPSFTSAISRA